MVQAGQEKADPGLCRTGVPRPEGPEHMEEVLADPRRHPVLKAQDGAMAPMAQKSKEQQMMTAMADANKGKKKLTKSKVTKQHMSYG